VTVWLITPMLIDENSRIQTTAMTPYSILKQAIKAEPAVKVALGVTGLAAAAAIVKSFSLGWPVAVFGSLIVLILMFQVLLFSHLKTSGPRSLHRPALFLTWCFAGLSVVTGTLLCSSAFFNWPAPLRDLWAPVVHRAEHDDRPNVGILDARLTRHPTPRGYALEIDVGNLSTSSALPLELTFTGQQDNSMGHSLTGVCLEIDEVGYGEMRFRGNEQDKREAGLPQSLMDWRELWARVEGVGVETEEVGWGNDWGKLAH
jgi:hypothetical protein